MDIAVDNVRREAGSTYGLGTKLIYHFFLILLMDRLPS